jgi:NTE family protein
VPGVWPPVTIGDRRYMDGGVGSIVNMVLAKDCDVAVVLVPSGRSVPSPFDGGAAEEVDAFGGSTFGLFADDESLAAFGSNPLDPACRKPSALAGREQGRRVAAAIADFLGA